MARLTARVVVTLKPVVNDPQGLTVRAGLHRLGFSEVSGVRVGKFMELDLEAESEAAARPRVQEMCQKLLANHVIEDVRFQLESRPETDEPGQEGGKPEATGDPDRITSEPHRTSGPRGARGSSPR